MEKPAQTKRWNAIIFGAFALAMGACSDSSNTAQDEIAIKPFPSFTATNGESQRLFAEYVSVKPTAIAQLPVAGRATYSGAVSYVDSNFSDVPDDLPFPEYERFIIDNPDFVSRIGLVADFGADSVSGQIGGFRLPSNRTLFIDLEIEGTIGVSPDDTGAFVGTLTGENEVAPGETKSLSGAIAGNFLGNGGEAILGTLAIDGGLTGEQLGAVFGVFTAEQPR